jgi:hypothetical protein
MEKCPRRCAGKHEAARRSPSRPGRGRLTASIGLGERERRKQRCVQHCRTRHFHQEPTDFHFPGLPEIEFHDTSLFEGIAEFESASNDIRAEYEELVKLKTAKLEPYSQYPDHVPCSSGGS